MRDELLFLREISETTYSVNILHSSILVLLWCIFFVSRGKEQAIKGLDTLYSAEMGHIRPVKERENRKEE